MNKAFEHHLLIALEYVIENSVGLREEIVEHDQEYPNLYLLLKTFFLNDM